MWAALWVRSPLEKWGHSYLSQEALGPWRAVGRAVRNVHLWLGSQRQYRVGPLLFYCGLPGDLGWRRGLDSAGQQDRGALPDGVGTQGHPEPGPSARAQLPKFLSLPDLCFCLLKAVGRKRHDFRETGCQLGVLLLLLLSHWHQALKSHPCDWSPFSTGQSGQDVGTMRMEPLR